MAAKKTTRKAEANTPNLAEIVKWIARLLPVAVLLVGGIFVMQQLEDYLVNEERFQLGACDGDGGTTAAVHVRGIVNASEERIQQIFADDVGRSLYLFPVEERRRRLLAVNWVKDATVARIWPRRVEVSIREREPAAFVHLQSSPPRVALIDEDGVILDPPQQNSYELPVLRGISEDIAESVRAVRVRRAIALMSDLGPIADQISEIDVSEPDNLMIRQSIAGKPVLLLMGKKNFRRRVENFLAHFTEIRRRLPKATTFDLRLDDRITVVDAMEAEIDMQIVAGLDAGSLATRCMIYGLEDSKICFLGYGEAPAAGWFKGRLTDPERLSRSILAAVNEAKAAAGVQLESVVVGVGGPPVYGFNHHWPYQFGRPREVDASDLQFAVEKAADVNLENDRMILHVCPQDFTVEGQTRHHFPRGAVCKRLEANVHLVTTSTLETQAIVSAVHQAHLAVDETVFEPLAAAYACVLQDDRTRGVTVVDIGLHSTEIVVYDGDSLVHSRSLPVCGEHFTKDVAWGFTVAYDDAEALKSEYGCAILGLTADNSLIVVPPAEGREPVEAPRRRLIEILEARAEELFLYVEAELRYCGMDQSLVEGVVLTGGGSMLPGMCDMAERVLNCQARKGLVVGVKDYPEECDNPVWTPVAGLTMYAARLRVRNRRKRRAPGLLGLVFRQ